MARRNNTLRVSFLKKLLIALLAICLSGCGNLSQNNNKNVVVVSIPPYAYFVNQIAGDLVHVVTAVPPGQNPHLFEPSPKQMTEMEKAQVWIGVGGESFEYHTLNALLHQNPQLYWLNLSSKVHLLAFDEGACFHDNKSVHKHPSDEDKNLHIWMGPTITQTQVIAITQILITTYPEHEQDFIKGEKALLQKLTNLDSYIKKTLAPYKHTGIIVSHPAFGYFCHEYDLIQIAVECEGKAPQIKRLMDIVDQAKELKVKCAINMPEFNNQGLTLIAEKMNLTPHSFDPLVYDYVSNMSQLADLIAKANQGY